MWSIARALPTLFYCATICLLSVPAQVRVSAASDDVPHCTQQVQNEIAALCAGSFSALISQPSGAEALLCMPPPSAWNGDLLLFARGNTRFRQNDCKLASITGQLSLGETSLPGLVNQLGFGFATSTCSEDVLAVGECKNDLTELAANFQTYLDTLASRNNLGYGFFEGLRYLTGASMGGLVATQLIEEDAGLTLVDTQPTSDQFDGALAACGPIGDFQKVVRYQGDLLVLTDCLYQNELELVDPEGLVFADEALKPVVPATIANALDDGFCLALAAMIDAAPRKATRILRIMAAMGQPVALDPTGQHTVGQIIADVLCSDILPAITVSEARFDGNPYDNLTRRYFDPFSSRRANRTLNRCVDRFAADAGTEAYETSGFPIKPMVTLQTVLDPRVPFSQSLLYGLKVLNNGQIANYVPIPSPNFGHCAFNKEEVLAALSILVFKVSGFDLLGTETVLQEPEALDRFDSLIEQFLDDAARSDRIFDEAIDGAKSAAGDLDDAISDIDIPGF
jgi:hypothetical protein